MKKKWYKMTSFQSKTRVKTIQIPITNAIIQKVKKKKTKLVNNYRTYERKKNKMIKVKHTAYMY